MKACVLATVKNDSHTWNLVYMQLLLEEMGYTVANLGACTAPLTVSEAIEQRQPDLVVISSINGHAFLEGGSLIRTLRRQATRLLPPIVIGGRLTTVEDQDQLAANRLVEAGFTAAFAGPDAIERFREFLGASKNQSAQAA